MLFARRRHGIGLPGILIIGAVLYFSGAGAWMWKQLQSVDQQCYGLLNQLGTSMGSSVCRGMGSAVAAIDSAVAGIGDSTKTAANNAWFRLSGGSSMDSLLGEMKFSHALKQFGSSASELSNQLLVGPQQLSPYANATERLRSGLDNFNLGKRYLQGDGSSADKSVQWFQTGAANPGYGILSQLALGDLYRTGYGNIGKNPAMAAQYYGQASQSINILQQQNTVESQQLLKSLPSSPQNVQQQINAVIQQLKVVKQ